MNDLLEAIAASLLMEQVLAPNFKFKTRKSDDELESRVKPVAIDYIGAERVKASNANVGEADLNAVIEEAIQCARSD